MQYMVKFDRSDIWLDRPRKIEDNDGWKREISYFTVIPDVRGKSIEILMWGKKGLDKVFSPFIITEKENYYYE